MNSTGFFAHPKALVDTSAIGSGTRIWAFAHVMKGARIGDNCNIGEQCFIEGNVTIGSDVVIKNGVAVWEGVQIADKVFVGPNAVFTNDIVPRAKVFKHAVPTQVCEGASIGANATIRCGVQIGRWAVIGAGAVVTRDVPPFGLVVGNPARVRGFVCRCGEKLIFGADRQARCICGSTFEQRDGTVHEMAVCSQATNQTEDN